MTSCFNPKKIIIEYIDSLINLVDIHTEEQIQKYPDNDFITIKEYEFKKKKKEVYEIDIEEEFDENYMYKDEIKVYENLLRKNRLKCKFEPTKPESEKTRVWDYLNGIRHDMIKGIREAETEALKQLEMVNKELDLIYEESKDDNNASEEQILSKVFCRRFPFIIKINKTNRHESYNYEKQEYYEPTVFVNEKALEFNLFLIDVGFFLEKFELTLLKYKILLFFI